MGAENQYLKAIAGESSDPNIDDKFLGDNGKLLKKIYNQSKSDHAKVEKNSSDIAELKEILGTGLTNGDEVSY